MKIISEADPVLQLLSSISAEWPALGEAARIYGAILPLLDNAKSATAPVSLTRDDAIAKLEAGVPLLCGIELDFDLDRMNQLAIQLLSVIDDSSEGAALKIRSAIESGSLDVGEIVSRLVAGDKNASLQIATSLQLDAALLHLVTMNALRPALRQWNRDLRHLAENFQWAKDYCFICGGRATIGELRGDRQSKHLRCAECGADWRVPRLQCSHCGNSEHNTFGYLYAEEKPDKIMAELCDKCHGYLKVITSYGPLDPGLLLVEDLATLHIDLIAEERGYERVRLFKSVIINLASFT
jgi:FdhE protein